MIDDDKEEFTYGTVNNFWRRKEDVNSSRKFIIFHECLLKKERGGDRAGVCVISLNCHIPSEVRIEAIKLAPNTKEDALLDGVINSVKMSPWGYIFYGQASCHASWSTRYPLHSTCAKLVA